MAIVADGSAAWLHSFVTSHIEPGARVITGAWRGYNGLQDLGYTHERRNQRAARAGEHPAEVLPAVHRVAPLARRWLLGTHQGSVDEAHLPSCLDEFVFRFNRRRSHSRGLVFYRVLELASPTTRCATATWSPASPSSGHLPGRHSLGATPPSPQRPPAGRPWRTPQPAILRLNGGNGPKATVCGVHGATAVVLLATAALLFT